MAALQHRAAAPPLASFGSGACSSHHGELIQGALCLPGGGATPCLLSLPRPDRGSVCRLELFETNGLEVTPRWKRKALRGAQLTLARYGFPEATGRLSLRCELAAGLGLGSSTADVVAAIRAAADALGARPGPEEVAALAVEAETASDPTMFSQAALLFAPRLGRVLEHWGDWYPDYLVFGCTLRPGGEGIDTLGLPPERNEAELDRFARLVELARRAFRSRDAAAIAVAATQSARLNQSRVPLERFNLLLRIAADIGALGVQIAHSGVVGGVLLDPQDAALNRKIASLARAWQTHGDGRFELFRTGA
jgi:uncharacterized protein involved in propanediol utilization